MNKRLGKWHDLDGRVFGLTRIELLVFWGRGGSGGEEVMEVFGGGVELLDQRHGDIGGIAIAIENRAIG